MNRWEACVNCFHLIDEHDAGGCWHGTDESPCGCPGPLTLEEHRAKRPAETA